jgi:hypothetical protein
MWPDMFFSCYAWNVFLIQTKQERVASINKMFSNGCWQVIKILDTFCAFLLFSLRPKRITVMQSPNLPKKTNGLNSVNLSSKITKMFYNYTKNDCFSYTNVAETKKIAQVNSTLTRKSTSKFFERIKKPKNIIKPLLQ